MRAFITGCGSGFGHRLARRLLQEGWEVVASDPELEALSDLEGAEKYCLDVRDAEQVTSVCAAAAARPIDLLVNNAGYAVFGTQEETPISAVAEMFEVNVIGLSRVTQALLPTLRSSGATVVNLSSVAGRTVFPESGYYAASKYAVEALTEALYQETSSFGMRARLIQPGSFATRFLERATDASLPRDPRSPYASQQPIWDTRKFTILEPPQDPQLVVEAIVASLDDPRPFLRVPVGPDALRLLGLRDRLSPDAWVRLAGLRNGSPDTVGFDSDAYTPSELAALDEPCAARLEASAHALTQGHLDHWSEDERDGLIAAINAAS
ncbi:MAG: SDR family oxidoreductase [Proteobacteria bacterium]|nr:SDR family oxidoreductase [Pseudomonadota bacterium]